MSESSFKVFKYPFQVIGAVSQFVDLEMPKGARVLSIQMQDGKACIWALVNTLVPLEVRKFVMFGTGMPIYGQFPPDAPFVGTIQADWYVGHVFDITNAD